MYFSCSANSCSYPEIPQLGFDGVLFSAHKIAAMEEDTFQTFSSSVQSHRIGCHSTSGFCKPSLILCGPGYNQKDVETYTCALAKRASQLGVQYMGIGSPNARNYHAAITRQQHNTQWLTSLSTISAICESYGIGILIEPICSQECSWVTTIHQALESLSALSIQNTGLVLDLYHAILMGEDSATIESAASHIRVVHAAAGTLSRRCCPSAENAVQFAPYIQALLAGGFKGEVAVEAPGSTQELSNCLVLLKQMFNNA